MNRIRIRPSRRPAEPKKPFLRDVRDNKQLYLLLLPFCVVFLLMFVIPIAASMVLSLTYYNMFNTPKFIGPGQLHQPVPQRRRVFHRVEKHPCCSR